MDRTGADFAVMSGGGIRDSIETGDITYKDVLKVQPFGNTVVYTDMTGKEVTEYLSAVAQKNQTLARIRSSRTSVLWQRLQACKILKSRASRLILRKPTVWRR